MTMATMTRTKDGLVSTPEAARRLGITLRQAHLWTGELLGHPGSGTPYGLGPIEMAILERWRDVCSTARAGAKGKGGSVEGDHILARIRGNIATLMLVGAKGWAVMTSHGYTLTLDPDEAVAEARAAGGAWIVNLEVAPWT